MLNVEVPTRRGEAPGERRKYMKMAEILRDLFESHLKEEDFFSTSVFYYLAGRFPDLTINECVDIVDQARKETGLI